ncbi:MAG: YibE/F family protein, partial [Candidatus Poribacteria bacterium]
LDLGKRLWLSPQSTNWNFSGILVAGMILGASGAIMDASMSVASAIEQVKKANPKYGIWNCIKAGMNVGKDEMGTMANTLVFAYIGADLTLILLPMVEFGEAGRAMPMTKLINQESTSSEVVQAIAGTIGIIMAIPITALVAGLIIGRISSKELKDLPSIDEQNKSKIKHLIFKYSISIALILISIGVHLTYSISRTSSESQIEKSESSDLVSEYVRAKIIEKGEPIETPTSAPYGFGNAKSEILKAELLGGTFKNEKVLVQNIVDPNRMPLANVIVNSGNEILLKIDGTKKGIERVLMVNYSRDGFLIYLAGLFVIVLVIVGRFQGIRTALALGISIFIVLQLLVPLIVKGYNALLVVVMVSGTIALSSLLIITGFNRKAGSATIGILGGVVIASFIIIYADQKLHFTGISSSRTAILTQFTVSEKLDFRNILMAGIIMGLLGSAMDSAVVVASAVREIKNANPNLSTGQLIKAGMSVGTDLLGTIANTLVFAYLGLRLILLMTFAGTSILSGGKLEILSTETISAEILRILAGSIGLVLTIPITAIVSALWDKIFGFLGLSRSL